MDCPTVHSTRFRIATSAFIDYSGHCSRQRACSVADIQISNKPPALGESSTLYTCNILVINFSYNPYSLRRPRLAKATEQNLCPSRPSITCQSMCLVKQWESRPCRHRWVSLEKPCATDRNFSNCPSFSNKVARPESRIYIPPAGSCPKCDKKDDYDGEKVRMVDATVRGVKYGTGPSKSNTGVEFTGSCCTIM